LPARRAEPKIQLGVRISEAKYRQFKLAAVLRGVAVQTLVEHAIQEFWTNRPQSLHSPPSRRRNRARDTRAKPNAISACGQT
jgi:hypothetical protein